MHPALLMRSLVHHRAHGHGPPVDVGGGQAPLANCLACKGRGQGIKQPMSKGDKGEERGRHWGSHEKRGRGVMQRALRLGYR